MPQIRVITGEKKGLSSEDVSLRIAIDALAENRASELLESPNIHRFSMYLENLFKYSEKNIKCYIGKSYLSFFEDRLIINHLNDFLEKGYILEMVFEEIPGEESKLFSFLLSWKEKIHRTVIFCLLNQDFKNKEIPLDFIFFNQNRMMAMSKIDKDQKEGETYLISSFGEVHDYTNKAYLVFKKMRENSAILEITE